MEILIITVGAPSKEYHKKIIEDKLKLHNNKIKILNLKEVYTPAKSNEKEIFIILEKESENIIKIINKEDYKIILDISSQNLLVKDKSVYGNGINLKDIIKKAKDASKKRLVFIIGSSFGLSEKIKKLSDFSLSLGNLTLNHQIVPALLLEILDL